MTKSRDRMHAANRPVAEAMRLHPFYRGKIQIMPKCPIRGLDDLAVWYTPGVAAPCKAIQASPDLVYDYTNKGNSVAIVSDGSRILGLGDIGPEAGLPVMEGKALLFKYLGGVDAVPICLQSESAEQLIQAVRMLQPSFGAINLEDIAQPTCFEVLDTLRRDLTIPVWHDDQQGTATVVLAGLTNALKLVGKDLSSVRIVMVGMGAANVAVYRMLTSAGVDPRAVVACDSRGILHPGRADIESRQHEFVDKWRVCIDSNGDALTDDVARAFRQADICIAFSASGPGVIAPDWVRQMAPRAIVFACANPVPEIWPWEAVEAGAEIVATGRSDFPNQVNNSLSFPGVFRGVLDVRASKITERMAEAAAVALADFAECQGLRPDRILPTLDTVEVPGKIAAAVANAACEEGVACSPKDTKAVYDGAMAVIENARRSMSVLLAEGIIAYPPKP